MRFIMSWIQIKINISGDRAESLGEVLIASGALSITFQDAHNHLIFEPLPGETRL